MGLERAHVSDAFLARGKQMIADGLPTDHLREQLNRERELEIQRLVEGEKIFRSIRRGGARIWDDRHHCRPRQNVGDDGRSVDDWPLHGNCVADKRFMVR